MKTKLNLKKIVKKCVLAGLFLIWTVPLSAENVEYAPSEILVKFKAATRKNEARAAHKLRRKLNAKEISRFGINNVRHIKLPRSLSVKKAILEAYRNSDVVYAEPNYRLYADFVKQIPNDSMYNQLWAMEKIQAEQAWDITTGSNEIIVAVIDSGVDYTHPDLADNIWVGPNGEHGYDFFNDDPDPMDDAGHGTHCAGTIAAVANNNIGVVGVAPNVKIMALKFLDSDGSGSTAGAIAALEYAVNHGAKITSNSYGGNQFSQALLDAVIESQNAGTLFVAAAGNESMNNDLFPHYPSSFEVPNVISVAATDKDDYLALFSCYGPESVDLAAPGVDILSTIPGNQYDSYQGTSMACPHVSGVCALIWSDSPDWSNSEVKERLLQSVDNVDYLQGMVLTGGRLNAYKALEGDDVPDPEPGNGVIIYDDMEGGAEGWIAEGTDNLWHLTNYRYTSENTSWYYGRENEWNYDTGSANNGTLLSPDISLRNISTTNCTLTFNHWREVEENPEPCDVAIMKISTDNGNSWKEIWRLDSTISSEKTWKTETISLDDYIGHEIMFAFEFNTVGNDCNYYEGLYIDDLKVVATVDNLLSAPSGLQAVAGHREVNLTWNANTEPDTAGYNVYRKYDTTEYRKINHNIVTTNSYKDIYVTNYIPYKYVVTAVDNAGNESTYSNEVSAMSKDGIPPYAPSGLTAIAKTKEVNLTWNKVWEPDVARYNIYRKHGNADYQKIHSVPATLGIVTPTNSTIYKWKDTGLTNGITYQYAVTAVDNEGNESSYSNEVSVMPEETVAPAAPSGIKATVGNSEVDLTWNENTESDLAGYNIYRKDYDNLNYEKINSNLIETTNYKDTSVCNGTIYEYVLTAVDNEGNESIYSSVVLARPKGSEVPPDAPCGLVSIGYYKYIELNWNPNVEDDISGYNVYRHIHNGQTPYWHYEKITDELVTDTHYIDTDVWGRFDYSYKVTAVDIYGNESLYSNQGNAFLIQPKPIMVIDPQELLEVTLYPDETATQQITIANEGDATLRYYIMPWLPSWLKIDCMEGEVEPGDSKALTATYDSTGLKKGDYDGYVEVSGSYNFAMLKAYLIVEEIPAPDIAINPGELPAVDILPNGKLTQTLTITNNGTEDLTVNINSNTENGACGIVTENEAYNVRKPEKRLINRKTLRETDYLDGEIIVKIKPNVRAHVKSTFSMLGAEVEKAIPEFGIYYIKVHEDMIKTIEMLNERPEIEYAEPNFIFHATKSPNDLLYFWQWGLHNVGVHGIADSDIDAPEAWDITTGSKEVVVAVLDTGVDYTHPDLRDNIWINEDEIPDNGIDDDNNGYIDDVRGWDFVNNDNDPMDDHCHGTFCSGIIGAVGNNSIGISGVCWNVKIMPLKILDENGQGGLASALEALAYAINKGARITSNSYGGYVAYENRPLIFKDLIESKNENGEYNFLFIAAAGNDGRDNDDTNPDGEFPGPHYPSSFDSHNIIAVAASNYSDKLANYFTDGWDSNYGKNSVDLAAPGDFIYSTGPYHGYYFNCGTSTACPFVAGTCALVLSEYPFSSSLQIKDRVLSGVDRLDALSDKVLTGGRLNAHKALTVEIQGPWLSVNPDSVVVTPGDSQEITITYDSTGLVAIEDRTYNGSIVIDSNDPDTPEIELPVRMNVIIPSPNIDPKPSLGDSDCDGIYDVFDAFCLDPTEWEDTDGDGMGNNADWDDDDDGVADEDDVFPLNIRKSQYKASPSIFTKITLTKQAKSIGRKKRFDSIDELLLVIPESTDKKDIERFVRIAHKNDTIVLPLISVNEEANIKERIDSIMLFVSNGDFDGVVIDSKELEFIANLSAVLHNKGKRLILTTEYIEDLHVYDLSPYIDKFILKVNSDDAYTIESAFMDATLQVQEEKVILELPGGRFCDSEIEDILLDGISNNSHEGTASAVPSLK